MDWRLGEYELTSITAYRKWENTQFQDQDRLPAAVVGFPQQHDRGDLSFDQVSEERWRTSVQRLISAHGTMRSSLAAMSDDDLRSPAPGSSVPQLATVRGLIAHDSYHCGQICYLRALQGVPAKVW